MKLNLPIVFTFLFCCFLGSTTFAQSQKWYMNYYEIDFSSTPLVGSLPFNFPSAPAGTAPYEFANVAKGYHDNFGNLLFYTVWNDTDPVNRGRFTQVYNQNGNFIGDLYTQDDGNEINIVPFPNNTDKYLLIYPAERGAGATRFLDFVILDISTNTISQSYEIAFAGIGVPTTSMAVSQLLNSGTRYLYTNINRSIQKYIIDFSWASTFPEYIISPDPSLNVYTFQNSLTLSELELSSDNNKLALAEIHKNKAHVISLDASGNFSAINTFSLGNSEPFNESVFGAEFNVSSTKLFLNYSHPLSCDNLADEGIYVVDLATNTVSSLPILNTQDYNRSQIELAFNGNLYVAGYDGVSNILLSIDPTTELVNGSTILPDVLPFVGDYRTYSCNSGYLGYFTLPDQIDGEQTIISSNNNLQNKTNIEVFPNPFLQELNIRMEENTSVRSYIAKMYNNLGQLIYSFECNGHLSQINFEASVIPNGLYHIVISGSNNEKLFHKKLIKQN